MTEAPVILWFRQDLRLSDHPALNAALATGAPLLPLFVDAPGDHGDWAPGPAARWWLRRSLAALDADLRARGSRLILRAGPCRKALRTLAEETGAAAIYRSRCYEPHWRRVDEAVDAILPTHEFPGSLLSEPWDIETGSGGPYKVFTPYWRKLRDRLDPGEPLPAPKALPAPRVWPDTLDIDAIDWAAKDDWADGVGDFWPAGEAGAQQRLQAFLRDLERYPEDRDRPDHEGTSRLSPYLRHGEISPRQVWQAVQRHGAHAEPRVRHAGECFRRQIAWREFGYELLWHFPHTPAAPLVPKYERFPWREEPELLAAWQEGRTGYPIVDAGMRQLRGLGWMHNRVRMIVASFLTKDLRLWWQAGARCFWQELVDADLANNTLGWQWAAGCGADAQPFFRIFNPVGQGEKHDPNADYVARWVPARRDLPAAKRHRPGAAANYPPPVVDHAAARAAALEAYNRHVRGQ